MINGISKYRIVTSTAGKKTFARIGQPSVDTTSVYTTAGTAPKIETSAYKAEAFYGNNFQATSFSQGVNFASPVSQQNQFSNFLDGFVNVNDAKQLRLKYKDMYYFDNICGTAVDLRSELPFSEYTLTGIDDPAAMRVYEDAMEELKVLQFLRRLLADYFVFGASAYSMIFDNERKIFLSPRPLDLDRCTFIPTPLLNDAPFINYAMDDYLKPFIAAYHDGDKRVIDYVSKRNGLSKLLANAEGKDIKLDPETTLYLERNDLSISPQTQLSYYSRAIKFYEYEKRIFRGTLDLSEKRLKSILHLTVGSDTIIPTSDTLAEISNAFKTANLDPTDAIVATHNYVSTNEIRTPTDFWRWDDISDFINRGKMTALGINEQFLSGESTYACCTGDTLIQTEQGLLRIDEIASRDQADLQDISIVVNSRYQPEKAVKWLYSGYADTLHIQTLQGYDLKCTPNHPLLVLRDGTLDWVAAEDIYVDDLLCVATKPLTRQSRLQLNLATPTHEHGSIRKVITPPVEMTEDLAFILGCIISDGYTSKHAFTFCNTDERLLAKFDASVYRVFGLTPLKQLVQSKGDLLKIGGNKISVANADCYSYMYTSLTVVEWLAELGCYTHADHKKAKDNNFTPSYYKQVPWSILQADEKSQLAFLAAYLDCDGSISKTSSKLTFISVSRLLCKQLQLILSTHGILTTLSKTNQATFNVTASSQDARNLYLKLQSHLVSKRLNVNLKLKARNRFSIPKDWLDAFLASRLIKADHNGTVFRTDSGTTITVKGWNSIKDHYKRFLYDIAATGKYDKFLQVLRQISETEYKKFRELLDCRFKFVSVKAVELVGKQHVYDLSMQKGVEPAFVANGLVVHNSMESALTVFLEQLLGDRTYVTDQVFTKTLFPYIAKENGFITSEDRQRIREVKSQDISLNPLLQDKDVHRKVQYQIPTIVWHKSLKPKADKEWLDTLQILKDQEIPIPFRMWLTAAGINIDELMSDYKTDNDLVKASKDYQQLFEDTSYQDQGMSEDDKTFDDYFKDSSEEDNNQPSQGEEQQKGLPQGATLRRLGIKNRKALGDLNSPSVNEFFMPKVSTKGGKLRSMSKAEKSSFDEKANRNLAAYLAEKDKKDQAIENKKYNETSTKKTS